jgi:hypothetical protein
MSQNPNNNNNAFSVYRRSKGFAPFVAEMLAEVLPPVLRDKQGIALHIDSETGHFNYEYTRQLKATPMLGSVPITPSEATEKANKFRSDCKTKLQNLCKKHELPSLLPDYLQPDGQPQPVYAEFFGVKLLHYWEVRYVPQVNFGERQTVGALGVASREPLRAVLTDEPITIKIGMHGTVVGISSSHTPFETQPERKPIFRLAPLKTEIPSQPNLVNTDNVAARTAVPLKSMASEVEAFMPSLKARTIGDRVVPFYVFEDGTERCAVEGVSEEQVGNVKNRDYARFLENNDDALPLQNIINPYELYLSIYKDGNKGKENTKTYKDAIKSYTNNSNLLNSILKRMYVSDLELFNYINTCKSHEKRDCKIIIAFINTKEGMKLEGSSTTADAVTCFGMSPVSKKDEKNVPIYDKDGYPYLESANPIYIKEDRYDSIEDKEAIDDLVTKTNTSAKKERYLAPIFIVLLNLLNANQYEIEKYFDDHLSNEFGDIMYAIEYPLLSLKEKEGTKKEDIGHRETTADLYSKSFASIYSYAVENAYSKRKKEPNEYKDKQFYPLILDFTNERKTKISVRLFFDIERKIKITD